MANAEQDMTELTRKSEGHTGFQNLVTRRSSLQWRHVKNLLHQGSNREAAAIVESFELQMSEEQRLVQTEYDYSSN